MFSKLVNLLGILVRGFLLFGLWYYLFVFFFRTFGDYYLFLWKDPRLWFLFSLAVYLHDFGDNNKL